MFIENGYIYQSKIITKGCINNYFYKTFSKFCSVGIYFKSTYFKTWSIYRWCYISDGTFFPFHIEKGLKHIVIIV